MDPVRWYRSKVDAWLGAVLVIAPLFGMAITGYALAQGPEERTAAPWGALAVLGTFLVIYGGLVFPMRYGIEGDHLVVRYGQIRQRIALASIRAVLPTRNPLSSPALSLDRLRIEYGDRRVRAIMISPADRQRFLDELADRARLERDGERLVRRF